MKILVTLTEGLPVGTNLALLQFCGCWSAEPYCPSEVRSSRLCKRPVYPNRLPVELGLPSGVAPGKQRLLLRLWQEQIEGLPGWQVHRHEGYRAITVDVTAFWRPALKNCPSKHYHPAANRALPAVIFGVIGEVGQIGGQRLACPLAFERVHPKDPSEQPAVAGLVALGTSPFGC